MFDDTAKLDLKCPNCGHGFKGKLGELRKSKVTCPNCEVTFEGSHLDRSLRKAEDKLKRFGQGI